MLKKVGTCVYVHKSNLGEMINKCFSKEDLSYLKNAFYKYIELEEELDAPIPDIIKYDTKSHNMTFIHCPSWDELNEPIVGLSCCVHPDGIYKFTKGGTKVYHHKWMFVADNYTGFDIQKSKERSKQIEAIPNIKSLKSKIGNVKFWEQLLKENGMEV